MRPLIALSLLLSAASAIAAPAHRELRLMERKESLTGTHTRYKLLVEGLEVVGGEIVEKRDWSGRIVQKVEPATADSASEAPMPGEWIVARFRDQRPEVAIESLDRVLLLEDTTLRQAWRLIGSTTPIERYTFFLDAESGAVIKVVPLFFTAVSARLFESNPVTRLNNPALQDNDDSPAAVPDTAYSFQELTDVNPSGPLRGPFITITELEAPATQRADASEPLNFDRSMDQFEEVMAYYHLDTSQRYLQSLGFTGAKQIITRSLKVDAHGVEGTDNSYYAIGGNGEGNLYFGDGGVDDAEDPDILLHEYGHAVHEAISPSAFLGSFNSQGRAMGEAFGDYWAFSSGYEASLASGRDPFCIGDWDARCGLGPSTSCLYPAGANCLRRVDGTKTMNDYISSDSRGTEHRNGEIWSSALREIFLSFVAADGVALGRRNADRLVVESIFGLTSGTSFYAAGRQLILADGSLYGGAHASTICAAMTSRGIFSGADCGAGPRGETTLFAKIENRQIPDVDLTGLTFTKVINEDRIIDQIQVRVAIEHTYRGDLRLSLTGPNGVTVLLQANSTDSGNDLRVTYGLDTQSRESLDVFRGISARGEWKLQIADVARGDIGNLLSWGLIIRFAGDVPITERSLQPGPTQHIVRVTDSLGVQEDIRMFNRSAQDANVTIFFTARNANGATEFAAVKVMIAPGQIVALEDVVSADLRTTGTGNLEFRGDVDELVITSRTVHENDDGSHGEVVRSISNTEAIARSDAPIYVPHLRSGSTFSSTIGITETAGFSGTVELVVRDREGNVSAPLNLTVQPWSTVEQAVFTGTAVPIGRAELRVVSGDARILAYGLVRDAVSGDAMHVPAVKPLTETRYIPVAVRTAGLRNTAWRTELALTNASASSTQNILITLEPDSGDSTTRSLVLLPGRSAVYQDVIETLFSRSAAAGKLVVHTTTPQELVVTSRTWTTGPDGNFGEFVPARRFAESTGRGEQQVNAINLENSAAFRTNIGLTEVVGNDMTVRIRIFDAQNHQIFTTDQYVGPRGHLQFNLANAGAPEFLSGRASFEVIAGAGRLFAYASVIDNASGDPVYIAAE